MSKQLLIARPQCMCWIVQTDAAPSWYLCGVCYPLIFTLPLQVMASTPTNAALLLFDKAYPGSKVLPDYFYVCEDLSIVVGIEAVGYVRAAPGAVFELGTIDGNGVWQPTR